jgi:hypothetical protein
MEKLIRSKVKSVADNFQEDGTMEVIVNSGKLDRQGEILDIAGLDLSDYLESPVVAWGHKYDEPSIGKATRIWKDSATGALKATVKFAIEHSDMAKLVYNLIKDGYMNAFSIGFIPLEAEEDENGNVVYTKSEMLEFSAVLVGADPRALATAKAFGGSDAVKALKGEINTKDFVIKKKKEVKEIDVVEKAGKVLSKANRTKVEDAIKALQGVLDADAKNKPEETNAEKAVDDMAIEIAEKALNGIKTLKQSGGRTDYKKVKKIGVVLYRAANEIIVNADSESKDTIKITKRN